MSAVQGRVYGTAGGSLQNSSVWAQNKGTAQAGSRGEWSTAEALHGLANTIDGPTVLHDLRIPIPGISANIDHIIVSRRRVLIVDTKLWKPGFYWTFAGRSYRGRERFASADKQTMTMARESIVKLLAQAGVRASVPRPVVLIWPSNNRGTVNASFLRVPGAAARTARQFLRSMYQTERGNADPKVVAALLPLVIGTKARRGDSSATRPFAPGEL